MLVREYRICMPITVDEVTHPQSLSLSLHTFLQYKIGQLYMIAKHSAEQSQKGEGVEVVENRPHSDPVRLITLLDLFSSSLSSSQVHGDGQFTEKRIYISR